MAEIILIPSNTYPKKVGLIQRGDELRIFSGCCDAHIKIADLSGRGTVSVCGDCNTVIGENQRGWLSSVRMDESIKRHHEPDAWSEWLDFWFDFGKKAALMEIKWNESV